MADANRHPTDAMQDALDDRLDADRRAALDAHLATCDRCRRELDALRWTRTELARMVTAADVPGNLGAQLRRALDEEDERHEDRPTAGRNTDRAGSRSRGWAPWVAAAAAIVAVLYVVSQSRRPSAPAEAAADLDAFVSGTLVLDVKTDAPQQLESRLQAGGFPFAPRVFDFGMMDYRLAGGGVHRIAGRPSALFAYRGPGDRALLCQMYDGTVSDLPAPADRRRHSDIEFLVYRENGVTVVFWQEGTVVCVLAADGDPEAAIRLAVAKAVKI